jgi:hypothetical protein
MNKNLLYSALLFVVLHIFVWISTNLQFVNKIWQGRSLLVTLSLAIPLSLCGYWASRFGYAGLEDSAWNVRFIGFGTSYLVFPIMTWMLLNETMFTPKTLVCIGLSIIIVCLQIFWR